MQRLAARRARAPSPRRASAVGAQVSAEVLAERKAAMELDFERNRLKPGDAGYEHDKRVRRLRPTGQAEPTAPCACATSSARGRGGAGG